MALKAASGKRQTIFTEKSGFVFLTESFSEALGPCGRAGIILRCWQSGQRGPRMMEAGVRQIRVSTGN